MSKVLIVEDDALLGKMVCTLLKKEGQEVFWAKNADQVEEAMQAQDFHLVLLDIQLPGIDGFEILKSLKSNEATSKIPVLMMSNLSGSEEIDRAMSYGADDFIIKANVEVTDLVQMLKNKYIK